MSKEIKTWPTWRNYSTGPTPSVLWVCMKCGTAFWGVDARGPRAPKRTCDKHRCDAQPRDIRRGTAAETSEAKRRAAAHDADPYAGHLLADGAKVVAKDRRRSDTMKRAIGGHVPRKRRREDC